MLRAIPVTLDDFQAVASEDEIDSVVVAKRIDRARRKLFSSICAATRRPND
jgi:hypothetical protein